MKSKKTNAIIVLTALVSSLLLVSSSFVFAAPKVATSGSETPRNSKNDDNKGQLNAASHRSTVANFVQNLLFIADRNTSGSETNNGIGDQVRVIAQEQNEDKDIVANEIEQIENRNPIKTFLIGSDYKNLGALRSEMVKTRNHIDQLKRLVDDATTGEDVSGLQDQLKVLEEEQTKINDFITANEGKFSLFGWFVKLFNK